MAQVPVEEGVFTWPSDEPRLIGSKCADCGNVMFPTQNGCPKCSGSRTEEFELSRTGTLWTWTIQGYPPKSPPYAGNDDPKTFEPFGVGYVELAGECKVESRLTENDPAKLSIGMEMELVLVPLYVNDDGDEVITFAFAPVQD
ncbi:MAG: OB-fold domain-containing protein [Actinomycetota bacterium]